MKTSDCFPIWPTAPHLTLWIHISCVLVSNCFMFHCQPGYTMLLNKPIDSECNFSTFLLTSKPPPPSTTEGHIGGGETSQTRTPPSSNNTSEERQTDKSADNAFTGTVQVKEDLGDLKDLSLNDFESSLGKPWL